MKKRWVIGVCSLIMATGLLTGCGSSDEGKVVLNIYHNKNEIADQLLAATETYMKENPNVKINLETVGGSGYAASLRAKMIGCDPADLFTVGGASDIADWQTRLADLSDEPWVEYAVDGTLEDASIDGKVLGMPVDVEGYGLIYNKKIFEAAGIDASTLTTYDALDEAFQTLQDKIDAGELKDQFPNLEAVEEYPAKESWVIGLHTANVALANEFHNSLNALGSAEVDFTYKTQLEELIDLETKYTTSAGNLSRLNSVDYSKQVGGGLAIERVAVIQQGNWISPEVATVSQDVLDNLGILPIPLKGVVEDSIAVGVPTYWVVNNKSTDEKQQAAKDFLNWLYQSEEGKDIIVNQFSFIPPFTNYDGVESNDPLSCAVEDYVKAGKTMPWIFQGTTSGWSDKVAANVQSYFAGQMTWDECIAASQKDWIDMKR